MTYMRRNIHLERIAHYYDRTAQLYFSTIGPTCQAGLIPGLHEDPYRSTAIHVARRAQIEPGNRILDAGSGFCGPSVHICQLVDGVSIDAVTISDEQAQLARKFVADEGLSTRIQVHVGDYHNISMPDAIFDAAIFLESIGYSDDLNALYREIFRVMRPGGRLYIKDAFRAHKALTELQRRELDEFHAIYANMTELVEIHVDAIAAAGFRGAEVTAINAVVSIECMNRAMWEEADGTRRLSEFGRIHYREFRDLPLAFSEISAHKS
jgi:cyclopropane-fatty-acyl-phospholipid synthase